MVGFTESLNISVSVAIILQYLTTKLRSSALNWQLSEEEQLLLRLQWTKNSIRSLTDVLSRYYSLK
jgi:spoU protein